MNSAKSSHQAGRLTARRVAVVTDSASAIPARMAAAVDLGIAPMEITIDGDTYVDGPSSGLESFYDDLRRAQRLPTTSAPKPQVWLETFTRASKDADSILCITLASHLSAAYDSARVAAELAGQELSGTEIRVFDSTAAAGSQALIALEAARAAYRGAALEEVESVARHVSSRVRLVAYLDTLEYIHRGGRVPRIAVWASQLLNIKPVMQFAKGKVGVIARPRSRRRAYERLLRSARSDLAGKKAHVNVMHADAAEEASALLATVGDEFDCSEMFLTQFHPFMGAHTGPGLVGIAYWAE